MDVALGHLAHTRPPNMTHAEWPPHKTYAENLLAGKYTSMFHGDLQVRYCPVPHPAWRHDWNNFEDALDDYLARAAVQDDSSDDEDAELSTYDEWFALVAGALPAWKLKEDPNWVNALREVSQGQFGKLGWQPFFHCRAEHIQEHQRKLRSQLADSVHTSDERRGADARELALAPRGDLASID